MAVTYGSAAKGGSTAAGTTLTFSITVAATDKRLIVPAGLDVTSPAVVNSVTANGVAITSCGAPVVDASGQKLAGWWYQDNPTAGTYNIVVTSNTAITGAAACCIPLIGVDLARAPVLGTGNSGTSVSPACNIAVGGGANDLQLGTVITRSATLVPNGAPQAVVPSTPTLPIVAINTLDSYSADSITGAGPFGWTGVIGNWASQALTVFAPTGGGGAGNQLFRGSMSGIKWP